MLESNGVKYGEGDCAALSSIGIFSALEKVLQRLKLVEARVKAQGSQK